MTTTETILLLLLWAFVLILTVYQRIREWRKKKTCPHTEKILKVTNHAEGYRVFECKACGAEFIDTETTFDKP